MKTSHARVGAALLAATTLGLVTAAPPSGAQDDGSATIEMQLDGKRPLFSGPDTVAAGSNLEIVNKTAPRKIGPHSFSLVENGTIPLDADERKACRKFELKLCRTLLVAHEVDLEKEEINKLNVDNGKKGWDAAFGKKGDTWFTQAKGESESRKVTAKAGTTLSYFCVIHPKMTGEIEVTE